MAEAILFGHRSLQPLIDLQEELQKAVGKAKRIPYLEPPIESVLDFADGHRCRARARRHRRRDDRHRSEDGRPRRDRRGQGQGDKRSSTAGRPSSIPAGRSSATRCTASPTRTSRAPRRPPKRPARRSTSPATRLIVGHNVGFDIGVHRGCARRWHQDRTGSLSRHPGHRPRGLPGSRELQAADAVELLRRRPDPEPSGPARCRGDRQPAAVVRE